METWRHGDMDMETWAWRHGRGDMDMETWTWRHGDMVTETWTWGHRHGDMDMKTKSEGKFKTEAQTIFLNPFTMCSSCEQKYAICPFVDEKKQTEFICFQTG
jgi:hypothetical protein